MKFEDCQTVREQQLWMRWQAAEARADRLEGQPRRNSPPLDPRRRRSKLSPAALREHRLRCAARARLFRRGLCLPARRRVLDQARALSVVPQDFDEEMFLAGRGPVDDAPEVDEAGSDESLIALYPFDAPALAGSPDLRTYWTTVRLAEIEDCLDTADLELMRDFEAALPSLLANDATAPGHVPILNYRNTWKRARDSFGLFYYPNGQVSGSAGSTLFYASGSRAYERSLGIWFYPNGSMLTNGSGSWWTPDLRPTSLSDLLEGIRRAAGVLGPALGVGLGRIRDAPLFELAVLELAWWYLRQ